jgi:hypothetical protein
LFIPAPIVQATIVCIADLEFNEFVQTANKIAFVDQDKESMHVQLLLLMLDLSYWLALMNVATVDPKLGLTRLRQAHEVLHVLLDQDEQVLAEAKQNSCLVEAYLCIINLHES